MLIGLVTSLRRNSLLKYITKGKTEERTEVTGRQVRRRKQLLDDLKETRGYWKLKAEALDGTVWRTGLGRGCGPVVRQTKEWTNEWMNEWSEWMNDRYMSIRLHGVTSQKTILTAIAIVTSSIIVSAWSHFSRGWTEFFRLFGYYAAASRFKTDVSGLPIGSHL